MKKVAYYECKICGYRIPESDFVFARYDYLCCRCQTQVLAEYKRIEKNEKTKRSKN